jgi:hypothetical protein
VAPASTVQWSILRNTRRTQDVDFQPNDPLPAETLERGLDRVVAIVQELERDQGRSLRAAETDSTASLTLPTQAERASRVLGFDVNGNPVPVVPEAGSLAATPYALNILSAADAGAARGVLELTRTTTIVAAGSGEVFVDLPTGWRAARLLGLGLRGTAAGAQLLAQLRRVGQASEDSGGSSYLGSFIGRSNATSANEVESGNTSTSSIGLTLGIDSAVLPSGMFEGLVDTGLAGGFAQIIGTARGYHPTNFEHVLITGGRLAFAGQINRIRLFWTSGNWNAGALILERAG